MNSHACKAGGCWGNWGFAGIARYLKKKGLERNFLGHQKQNAKKTKRRKVANECMGTGGTRRDFGQLGNKAILSAVVPEFNLGRGYLVALAKNIFFFFLFPQKSTGKQFTPLKTFFFLSPLRQNSTFKKQGIHDSRRCQLA